MQRALGENPRLGLGFLNVALGIPEPRWRRQECRPPQTQGGIIGLNEKALLKKSLSSLSSSHQGIIRLPRMGELRGRPKGQVGGSVGRDVCAQFN